MKIWVSPWELAPGGGGALYAYEAQYWLTRAGNVARLAMVDNRQISLLNGQLARIVAKVC